MEFRIYTKNIDTIHEYKCLYYFLDHIQVLNGILLCVSKVSNCILKIHKDLALHNELV